MILNKILATFLMLGSFTIFDNCSSNTTEPVAPIPTPVVVDTDQCGAAEQHLHDLCNVDKSKNDYCCQVVAPTKKGKTYTQFCQLKQEQGVFLNPKCIANITSCDQIDACTHS